MNRRLYAGFALGMVVLTRALSAQATPFIAPTDRVYQDIDRLAASGLIDTLVVGARPFSEREIVRLLNEANRKLMQTGDKTSWAAKTVRRDLTLFARAEPQVVDQIAVEITNLDSPYRAAPADSNGLIPALINPLSANRDGRPLAYGQTVSLETWHNIVVGSHLALSVNPRLTAQFFRSTGFSNEGVQLQSGSANLLFGNLSIEGGRDYAVFGQSPSGGLLLSNDAPSLDMVRLSNDRPADLPGLLRFLGPIRASLFVADLGGKQIHPHAKLAGYHIALLPHPRLELGLEVLDAMGGRGGQPASFGDRVLDAIPIVDVFRANSDFQFSNKMAALDFHWRNPSWAGFELYGQTAVDDFDARRFKSVLLEDGGYLVGTALTCISECGRFGVRVEYHQTGIRFYAHPDYPMERNGFLLGDPLGPRGVAGHVTIDGDAGGLGRFAVNGALESRSGNGYGSGADADHSVGFHFFQVFHRPGEQRARATVTWNPDLGGGYTSLRLTSGAEHVTNFAFVAGETRLNWIASIGIVIR
jgi:capsule assembly protein Wzi